jgi:signal recognition particle subunit SRP54
MFESLSENLGNVFRRLRGHGRLNEKNIRDGMREVRTALLEADVSYKVVKDFVGEVTERAVGQDVVKHVRPDQQVVKVVYDELVKLMGETNVAIKPNPTGPTVIMMAGLQGSGKTTTCGKLALYLKKKGYRPLLVAADMQRPAAVDQLKIIGDETGFPVYFEEKGRPPKICRRAIKHAEKNDLNVVILDTAGRLHIDEPLMEELEDIVRKVSPQEILLITDAMSGQDAVTSSKEFNDRLEISGVILTKLDGDARGGAALSIRAVTGKPIKFVGVGEKYDKLEEFHPERMADRILGMGDVRTLVEKAQDTITQEEAEKMQEKLLKQTFDFTDFLKSMQQIRKMGSMKDVLGMIPTARARSAWRTAAGPACRRWATCSSSSARCAR